MKLAQKIENKLYKETHQHDIKIKKSNLFIIYKTLKEIFKLHYLNSYLHKTIR